MSRKQYEKFLVGDFYHLEASPEGGIVIAKSLAKGSA